MIAGKVGVCVRDDDGQVIPGLLRTGSRVWKDTAAGWIEWSGIFERPLDAKGRFDVVKVEAGVEVELPTQERETYLARRVEPERVKFINWEDHIRNFNGERVGLTPRDMRDPRAYGAGKE
jgi:hypothetical protein